MSLEKGNFLLSKRPKIWMLSLIVCHQQLWKKLMGVEDESIPEKKEDVPGKAEEPVEERISGAEEAVEEVEEVEVVPEEESV